LSKNIIIFSFGLAIVFLIGFIILTNYSLFSEGWFVGLGLILATTILGVLIAYKKIRNKFS